LKESLKFFKKIKPYDKSNDLYVEAAVLSAISPKGFALGGKR